MRETLHLFQTEATTLLLDPTIRNVTTKPLKWNASDGDAEVSTFVPPSCTADQLDMIYQRLPDGGETCGNGTGLCPISLSTSCPQASWLEDYYASQHKQQGTKKSFLAINVGCNKGYDAFNLLRMGSNNPAINRIAWKDAMPRRSRRAVCGQDEESPIALSSPSSLDDEAESSAIVYCIEPMLSTFLALKNAANTTGWDNSTQGLATSNEQ